MGIANPYYGGNFDRDDWDRCPRCGNIVCSCYKDVSVGKPIDLRVVAESSISIQRGSSNLETGKLYIVIDNDYINENAPITKGKYASYAIHKGTHYIHGVCGNLVSEIINFSITSKSASFVVEIVRDGYFNKKLVISQSELSSDVVEK